MATTVDLTDHQLTITTTVQLPTSAWHPMPIPTSEPFNTAAAVIDLYERDED